MAPTAQEIYLELKKVQHYDEKKHCPMIIETMMSNGTYSHFCVKAYIGERNFFNWLNEHPIFLLCYEFGKASARVQWEKEGERIRDMELPMGTIDYSFEHWKMVGWSRFGVGKNSRIRLNLNPNNNPAEHYSELLKQAGNGDFTAGEIKQLMEAINVGLNAHQVFQLQKEIDQLKSDLAKLIEIKNGDNSYTNKGIA